MKYNLYGVVVLVGLCLLKEKAIENFKTAEWAEKKRYFDAAVSRYYYCAYEKVIYISKKKGFYIKPAQKEDSHKKSIERFVQHVNGLSDEEILILLKMKKLRRMRNNSDYNVCKLDQNGFMLGFKFHFNGIIKIIDKLL